MGRRNGKENGTGEIVEMREKNFIGKGRERKGK
jgi:hypothetical protein